MEKSDDHKVDLKMGKFRKFFIFIIAAIDCMLFGGAVFGWPQLMYTLKMEGIYSDLCDDQLLQNVTEIIEAPLSYIPTTLECPEKIHVDTEQTLVTVNCPAQDERMALIYTSAVVFYGTPGILVGMLLHYAGLLITRITAGLAVMGSFICLAATTPETPDLLFPFMILLALGGNQVRMSVMQLGDLFPKYRSTAITFLTGIYAVSATLFIVFQLFEDIGINRTYVCYLLVGISCVTTVSSFAMPFHHVPHEESKPIANPGTKEHKTTVIPLLDTFITWSSFLNVFWMFTTLFAINLFQQFYNTWISASFCTTEEIELYSNLFSYVNLLSIFFSPLLGIATDFLIKKANKGSVDPVERRVNQIKASFISLFFTSFVTAIMYSCLFFFNSTAVIISLLSLSAVRCAVIAVSSAYVRNRFPAVHFNRLMGIYCSIMSALFFLQYYHFLWSVHSYYTSHLMVIVLILISFTNPLHLLYTPYLRSQVMKQFPHTVIAQQQMVAENLLHTKEKQLYGSTLVSKSETQAQC